MPKTLQYQFKLSSAFAGVSALALAISAFGPAALAQDAPPPAPPSAQAEPPAPTVGAHSTQSGLEEVTVTATKQAQSVDINNVPISISAYSQQDMDTQGVRNIADIAQITPGLNFSQQNAFGTPLSNIEIRGIQSRTSAPTTAIYLDDTPMIGRANNVNIGANGGVPQVFDLASVEVDRGPQGVLFGASAEGGAVRFLTNQPSLDKYSVYARTEFSGTDGGDPSYEAGAAVGGPIIDGVLGFRVSAWYRKDGGYIDRVQPPVGAGPFTNATGHLVIDPTKPGLQTIDANANWSDVEAGKLAFTWKPVDWLSITPSIFYQNVYNHDAADFDLSFSNPSDGQYKIAHSQQLASVDPTIIPSLKIEGGGNDVAFTSITSYYARRLKFQVDYTQYQDNAFFGDPLPLTGLPDDFGTGEYAVYQNKFTQEIRMASVNPNDRLTWVAGVYIEKARQVDQVYVEHPDLPNLVQQIYGTSIESILGTGPYLGRWVAYDQVLTNDLSAAIFGNADFKVTPDITLSVGGRWAVSDSTTDLRFDGSFNGGPGHFSGEERDEPFTPQFSVKWKPDESNSFYATVAEGYRVGGVNPQTNNTQAACQAALAADGLQGKLLQTYQPDSLWSYEIGAKDRLMNNRLEIQTSAYHIDWSNIQEAAQITNCGFAAVFNLGTAESNGFDVAVKWRATDNLKLTVDAGYTDAHYDTSQGGIVSKGDQIGGPAISTGQAVPPWSLAVSAEYDFSIADHDAYIWAQDVFHSKNDGPFSTQNPANIVVYDPDLVPDPSTNLVNIRAGMLFDNIDASIFVNNLLNSHPLLSVQHTNPGDPRFQASTLRPMTIGATITYKY